MRKKPEENAEQGVRATLVVGVVVMCHVVAIAGSLVFIQGCASLPSGSGSVGPPPAPIMPPTQSPQQVASVKRPTIKTPTPLRPEPAVTPPMTGGETYTIQKGDSLSTIAKRYGVNSRELAEINQIKNPNKIKIGQKLVLPPYASKTPAASKPKTSKPIRTEPTPDGGTYVVQAGDALSKIAKRFGTSVSALKSANQLSSDMIRVGQKLVIPGKDEQQIAAATPPPAVASLTQDSMPAPSGAEALVGIEEIEVTSVEMVEVTEVDVPAMDMDASEAMEYTVLTGDTVESVSKLFIVRKEELIKVNNLSEDGQLMPGTKILIPPPDI